jgi:hypothetical protein
LSGFCLAVDVEVIIVDSNGDSSVFLATAPYHVLSGWLWDCSCGYNFAHSDAYGGLPPYTYELSTTDGNYQVITSASTVEFTGLSCMDQASMVTITDSSGCSISLTPLIDAPCSGLPDTNCLKEIYLTIENLSDSSLCDGMIIWEIEGVDLTTEHQLIITSWAGYNDTLVIAPGVMSDTLFNLCSTHYTFKLDKDSSCFDFSSGYLYLPQPTIHTSFLETETLAGCSTCSNSLNWTFTDYYNHGPYQIYLLNDQGIYIDSTLSSWNNGSGTFQLLCADIYSVIVINALGDSLSSNIEVTNGTNSLSIDSTTHVNTYTGQSNGTIEVFISGGYVPYQYSIDGGLTWQSDNLFAGLPSGNYTLLAMDSTGCVVSTSVTLIDGDLGLSETEILLEIFPNPSDGTFILRAQGAQLFKITDLQGKIIYSGEFNGSCAIDLREESKGVYLISIMSAKNTHTSLLIIQ